MKKLSKSLFWLIIVVAVIGFVGELCSKDMKPVNYGPNLVKWEVNHFFNQYQTYYYTPMNDTIDVVVNTTSTGDRNIITVSDGKQLYDFIDDKSELINKVNKNDSMRLVIKCVPKSRNSNYKYYELIQ